VRGVPGAVAGRAADHRRLGRQDLTSGAVLLFVANLVAIVLISAVVLAASGFVPRGRFRAVSGRIRFGLLLAVAALALVAAPLTDATLASDNHAQVTQAVNQAAVSWLAAYPSLTLTGANITGSLVTVDVAGPASPPPSTSLAQALAGVLGPGAAVQVQWYQTTTAASTRSTASLSLTIAQLQPVVQSWLSDAASTLRVAQLTKNGDAVSVTLEGASAPPAADLLAKAISKRAGQAVTVSVTWRTPVPKPLAAGQAEAADIVISMGCGDACPVFPGQRYLTWELPDPAGLSVEQVRPIRDDIAARVQALLKELEVS